MFILQKSDENSNSYEDLKITSTCPSSVLPEKLTYLMLSVLNDLLKQYLLTDVSHGNTLMILIQ